MRNAQFLVTLILFVFAVANLPAQEKTDSMAEVLAARQAHDDARMETLRASLAEQAGKEKDSYQIQWDAAECFRMSATDLRTRRQASNLEGKEAKELKQRQEVLAAQGLVYGERAVALAKSEVEIAAAHRVVGELYANSITSMVSGFKNGPKARNHMDEAMKRTPDDPECQRAIGIMYLNNPPISGGDVPKAIETFSRCHELKPDNDEYMVMLAMAYQKDKQWDKALEAAEKALALNPANTSAAALRARIAAKEENAE
jgi:tetratricopeptide (TPR) repeat protein